MSYMKIILTLAANSVFAATLCASSATINFNNTSNFIFKPNVATYIDNPFHFSLVRYCTFISKDTLDKFHAYLMLGEGQLNDINIGSGLILNIHEKSKLKIWLASGSKIALLNEGRHDVSAKCRPN